MIPEPRQRDDYSPRQVEAARRVLVDLGQVLAAFVDCLVVVGGWVPDLLLEQAEEPHVGSIDVDLALDAKKLAEGRYADLFKLLLATDRYKPSEKPFQLVVQVDLKDGQKPVEVEVEFLAAREVKLKKNRPKFLEGFRVLQADACATAFHAPVSMEISDKTVRGANNKVRLRVASADSQSGLSHLVCAGVLSNHSQRHRCHCHPRQSVRASIKGIHTGLGLLRR